MIQLIALRSLCGDYGFVADGQMFETTEEIAQQLEARGLVERKMQRGSPENKMLSPAENKGRPMKRIWN